MGRISRGWALTKQSWDVLKKDSSLLVFPILATIFSIIAAAAIWVPAAIVRGVFAGEAVNVNAHDPVIYIAGAATGYVSTFFAIFFNVALAACAARSLRGEDTSVGEGLRAAMQRLGPIIGWSLVATTVGLILQAIEERLPVVGRLLAWLGGLAWAITTFFVVPVVALEGTGPWQSLKRSASIIKQKWGEGATGAATIGVVTFLISFAIIVLGGVGAAMLFSIGLIPLGFVVVAIAVVAVIVVALISSALSQIFRVAVYEYAVSGVAPSGFDGQALENAFVFRR
ncbi:MAG: hypothetical protein QOH60_2293 [Mycobacterium sp.]|jgi:ABC-type multidrug transport system fused ATPase/permease subunit|nr:hypothetical protein [Mycobacterium sp.]